MTGQKLHLCALVAVSMTMMTRQACAAGSGMPWEGALMRILDSCTGPVAQVFGTLIILGTGIGVAFGEGGGVMRKVLTVVFGLSIAFTAASFGLKFFGYAGGIGF